MGPLVRWLLLVACAVLSYEVFASLHQRPATRVVDLAASEAPLTSDVLPPPPRKLAKLFWLHIPKCGTSWLNVIFHYACPRVPENVTCSLVVGRTGGPIAEELLRRWPPWRWCNTPFISRPNFHNPYTPRAKDFAVGLFREPRARLVSAFHHNSHSNGMDPAERHRMLAALKSIPDERKRLAAFVAYPGLANCMTKMVLGFACASPVEISSDMLDEAKRRVREDFAFVGLTNAWNQSVCLFHRMWGGRTLAVEFENTRPGGYRSTPSAADANYLREIGYADRDTELYAEVEALFSRRLRQYGCAR